MRTTKATHAVERLKTRTGNPRYAAVSDAGRPVLPDRPRQRHRLEKLCAPLPPDEFVAFVNSLSPPAPRKASKLDEAFEDKIRKAKG